MIRRATFDDIPKLLEFGHQFVALSPFSAVTVAHNESITAALKAMMESPDAEVFVAEQQGEVVGTAAVALTPLYFNVHVKVAHEVFWWVDAAHRKGSHGLQLLQTLEEWASHHYAAVLTVSSLATNPDVGFLYLRMGYTPNESNFIKVL